MRNAGWVLVVLLAIGCGSKAKQGDLTVTGTPTGQVEEGQVRVILAFGRPMVAKDKIDQPVQKAPVAISPEIPFDARWSDEKTLVLVPTSSLAVSTRFVVTVSGEAKALDGAVLGKPYTFEFSTERLSGTIEVLGVKERAKKDQIVKLTFNQEVAFDQLASQCSFTAKSGSQKLKLAPEGNVAGPSKAFSIMPAGDLALDTDYTLACKAALKGTVGNLGLEHPLEEKLHTYGPLKYVGMDPQGNDVVPDENLRLKIAFTNPLAEPFKLTITPAVPGFPQGCHVLADSPAGVSCSGQFEARTSYTITVDAKQQDVFGQKLGKLEQIGFRTTDAKPTISIETGYFVAELKRPVVPLWTRNVTELSITAVKITQGNFHELSPLIDWWDQKGIDFAKAKQLEKKEKKVAITGTKNQWGQHSWDPTELFGGKPGPGMYYLEVSSEQVDKGQFSDGGRAKVLVNFTDIGVVSKLSPTRGLVWASTLTTGKPLPGATVSVRNGQGRVTWTGTTDAEGVAILPGTSKLGVGEEEHSNDLRIYVQQGDDWTMVNPTASGGLSTWSFNVAVDRENAPTKLRGFMHTDRGLYRPGDQVHVKGLARITKLGEALSLPRAGTKVGVSLMNPQGKVIMTTNAKLSAFGGFWFDLDLPGDARLGDYTISAAMEGGTFTRDFSVEEYRPATFEVAGKAKENFIVARGDIHATVSANYFYGAPVRTGTVDVAVHSRKRRVRFDQHKDFEFVDERQYESYYYYESEDSQSLIGEDHVALDQKGNANIVFAVSPNDIYSDADLLVRASVTSPSNEVISKTFTIPYFRAKTYFGIKPPGYFLDVKKPAKFQIVSVSPDGKVVDAGAKVKVTRRDWNCVWEDWGYRGSYNCKDTTQTIVDKVVKVTGGKPAEIEFTPATGGDYLITVEGENDKQEVAPAAQRMYAWGDGGGSWRSDDTLSFDIAADKKEYKAGDTATLILKTDLKEASGLVTIERDGVIEKRLIQISPTQKSLTIPINANYAPNVYVSVALVQGRTGDGPRGKPRMRMGIVNLPVRPEDNRLKVSVETDKKEYRPGAPVTATVKVTDMAGNPMSAEVSITAADEGVLSLIAYETPDPVPAFFAPWGLGVTSATQIEYIRDIPAPNVERPATGGDAAGTVRSRFVASAVWQPGVVTNTQGIATVTFNAPDNLTAFRLMAVAADKTYKFGSADKRFTVSKPLQLHSALPRFASLGDSLQAGVVVHNETKQAGSATVKLVTDSHVKANGAEKTVQVPAGGRVPVLFDLTPAEVGTAALTFSVALGSETDAVKLELPIQYPSRVTSDELAFGVTKDAKSIPVGLPADAVPSTAEVSISVDPDGLAGIDDGLRDLIGYPYGCLEQTTSKVIPMIAVRDLAESLAIDGLTGERLDGFVKTGITKINKHQTAYGGFSLWPGGEPEQYYTAYALWGLYIAKQAGYKVDESRIEEALSYLGNDGANPDQDAEYYSEAGNLGAQAFAIYVRAIYKDKAAGAAATTLLKEAKLPIYGKAYVARALAASVGAKDPAVTQLVGELAKLADAAAKTDSLIKEPDGDDLWWYMSSSMRTTSAVLSALVELDPKNAAIKPLVRSVMKNRRTLDEWDTQSNLYSLLALSSYAKSVGGNAPSVTVQLGDKQLVSGTLAGKQKLRVATVALPASSELKITPKGEVHYSVTLRYRKKPDAIKAESKGGIELTREYTDEAGKPKTSFQVGDVVVVKLHVKVPDESTHLMVSDALPTGFEALNTRLATVGAAGVKQTPTWWGNYREMHDERVDFASEWIYEGTFDYTYSIRAIAVGKFARPPATAELMYDPTKHAQTGLDYLEVKAK